MMMFCKFTYAAFYYADGRLKEIPSFSEYIGYLYFFPSSTIGPVFSFNDYTDYINLRVEKKNKKKKRAKKKNKN
jgi:D-alanyl-lipoteichoic acid acyltransferase DltB (MBOAT superfamily)